MKLLRIHTVCSIYFKIFLLIFIFLSFFSCSESPNDYGNIQCDNNSSDYQSGYSTGEIMATATDGKRDCSYGYENWDKKIGPSLGVVVTKTDCYCKGFYEGYDKTSTFKE